MIFFLWISIRCAVEIRRKNFNNLFLFFNLLCTWKQCFDIDSVHWNFSAVYRVKVSSYCMVDKWEFQTKRACKYLEKSFKIKQNKKKKQKFQLQVVSSGANRERKYSWFNNNNNIVVIKKITTKYSKEKY